MEPRPDRPPWLPVVRNPVQQPTRHATPDPPPAAAPPSPPRPSFTWQRLTRSRRGAAGLVIATSALLLWPFSGWSWIPWLIGIGLLVLLRLLRLDGLLRGWVLHLGVVVVVVGLMYSTSPWAWALAASIGVLLAGLLQLPWWRLAAVGVVLCVVSGVGFGISTYRTQQQIAAADAQVQTELQGQQGAARPQGVLPILLNRIAQNVPGPICNNLLAESARSAFVASTGQPDCDGAVAALASRVVDRGAYASAVAHTTQTATGFKVDACSLTWANGPKAGPQLGRLEIGQKNAGTSYYVVAFTRC
jgi:hypothetical protein